MGRYVDFGALFSREEKLELLRLNELILQRLQRMQCRSKPDDRKPDAMPILVPGAVKPDDLDVDEPMEILDEDPNRHIREVAIEIGDPEATKSDDCVMEEHGDSSCAAIVAM